MTNDQIFAIILSALTVIATLGSAWLSPYISNRSEQNKGKRRLKPDLIKNIYTFYHFRKIAYEDIVKRNFQTVIAGFLFDDSMSTARTTEEREFSRQEFQRKKEEIHGYSEKIDKMYFSQVDVESTLLATITEVGTYYDTETYNKIDKLVGEPIYATSKTNQYENFHDMTREKYRKILQEKTISTSVHTRWAEWDTECKNLIETINEVL